MLAVSGGTLMALSTPFGTRGWWYEAWRGDEDWERYEVPGGYTAFGGGGFESYPTLQVLKDGTLWGSYLDPDRENCRKGSVPTCSHMYAYRSSDHGRHWTRFDLTPKAL